MKVSLNELVQLVADRVGQPFNTALQEELKIIINYKLVDFFKKSVNQDPSQRKFFQRGFTVTVKPIDKGYCPVDVGDCKLLRSTTTIPSPLRTKEVVFDYVGSVDWSSAFPYAAPEQIKFLTTSLYTGDKPKYFFADQYLYILNNNAIREVGVRGIFLDLRQLNDFKCENAPCYTDDDQFDIPQDLINNIMRDILTVELRNLRPELIEVEEDESKE